MVRPLRAPTRALSSAVLAATMVAGAAIPAAAVHTSHHRAAAVRVPAADHTKVSDRVEAAQLKAKAAQHKRAQIRWHLSHDAAARARHALLHPSVASSNRGALRKSLKALRKHSKGQLPFGASVAVAWAYHEIGRPYSYGSAGPYAFDCSGLTRYVWSKAGVWLDHYSGAQLNEGKRIANSSAARPGDILEFAGMGHVALYVGDGWMIEAPHSGLSVWRVPVPWQSIIGITRPQA